MIKDGLQLVNKFEVVVVEAQSGEWRRRLWCDRRSSVMEEGAHVRHVHDEGGGQMKGRGF